MISKNKIKRDTIKEKPFIFKKFKVFQSNVAMKVGTDGVLLGAWCPLESKPNKILDIGSGTGLISLMLAQRSKAMIIDSIEIEDKAFEQTVINYENSQWKDRLYCYHSSFQDFSYQISEEKENYDLIISNPPFYTETFESKNKERNHARLTSSLSFKELLNGVSKILSPKGIFTTIIPFKEEVNFIKLAKQNKLDVVKICRIKGNYKSKIIRSLLVFSFFNEKIIETYLTIEKSRHQYTEDYIKLTKKFYIKM